MAKNTEYQPFPAADYIRDMREAGGSFKLDSYGHELIGLGGLKAREAYYDHMRADPDHLNKVTAELLAELALQKADPTTVFSDDELDVIKQIASDATDLVYEEIDILSGWRRSMRHEMAVLRAAVEGLQRATPAA